MTEPLECGRQIVLYRGQWRCLSAEGYIGFALLLFVNVFGLVLFRCFAKDTSNPWFFSLVWVALSLSCITLLVVFAVLNRTKRFEIRTDGIALDEVFYLWSEVQQLSASSDFERSASVRLFIRTTSKPFRQYVLSQNPLTTSMYESIIDDVRREISKDHPHVALGGRVIDQ